MRSTSFWSGTWCRRFTLLWIIFFQQCHTLFYVSSYVISINITIVVNWLNRVAHKDFFTFANLAKDFWFTFAKLNLPSPNLWRSQNYLRYPCIDYDFSTKPDQYISQGMTTTDSWWSRMGDLLLQICRPTVSCPYKISLVRLCNCLTYVYTLRRDQTF